MGCRFIVSDVARGASTCCTSRHTLDRYCTAASCAAALGTGQPHSLFACCSTVKYGRLLHLHHAEPCARVSIKQNEDISMNTSMAVTPVCHDGAKSETLLSFSCQLRSWDPCAAVCTSKEGKVQCVESQCQVPLAALPYINSKRIVVQWLARGNACRAL